MNSHATPRTFPLRSMPAGTSQAQQQRQQPLAPQVSANEEYSAIPDEDRAHIDEVVSRYHAIGSPGKYQLLMRF